MNWHIPYASFVIYWIVIKRLVHVNLGRLTFNQTRTAGDKTSNFVQVIILVLRETLGLNLAGAVWTQMCCLTQVPKQICPLLLAGGLGT